MRALVRGAAAAATALALLVTGCSGDGGGTDSSGKIKLRFQSLAWQKESVDANRQLVEEWNEDHPDIQVEYVQGSWDSVHDQPGPGPWLGRLLGNTRSTVLQAIGNGCTTSELARRAGDRFPAVYVTAAWRG
jgi:hypothetical protein